MLDDGIFPDKDIAKFVTQENDKDAKKFVIHLLYF